MKKSKERKASKRSVITGTVIAHPKGFGFVQTDELDCDVYLPIHEMEDVLHGDEVRVEIKDNSGATGGKKLSGRLVEIKTRATTQFSGVVCKGAKNRFYVQALDKRILHDLWLAKTSAFTVRENQMVVVEITQYPHTGSKLIGEVVEVLGDNSHTMMPIILALYKHAIPHVWSQKAVAAANSCPQQVTDQEHTGRRDLTDLPFVTIDGADARDFDDAILVDRNKRGWRLYVAIADVAHYIKQSSVLDRVAYERGTSVYFPGRVVPMLPEQYSNGICSLKPDVERLSLVCEINLDKSAQLIDYTFYEAVIKSHARLTYQQVWGFISDAQTIDASLHQPLRNAHQLFEHLLKLREKRGALDLDIPEAFVVLDENNSITDIKPVIRNQAHRLIEEFMLLANVCAANVLIDTFNAGIFRVHDVPDAERVADLRYFLSELDIELGGGDKPASSDFSAVLDSPSLSAPLRPIISTVMLRTQKQARYSEALAPHFALNYEAYTHFTSPIRRYPDLIVHRLLKAMINKQKPDKTIIENLAVYAEHLSVTERRAEEACRDVISYYKLKYLEQKVGEDYAGLITGITSFGFFVELDEIFTSGLVHISNLTTDYFIYDPLKKNLIGEQTGQIIQIGERVVVKIAQVNLDEKKLDLVLVDQADRNSRKSIKQKPKSKQKSRRRVKNK